jgi:hypothetical protein
MDFITETLDRLGDDVTDVFRDALEEALPLCKEEDAQLRELEHATLQLMQRIGQRFLNLLIEACQPE